MCNDSILRKQRGDVRSRAARLLVAVSGALVVSVPTAALAQLTSVPKAVALSEVVVSVPTEKFPPSQTVCGAEVKEEVAKALSSVEGAPLSEKLALEKGLYAQYQELCAADAHAQLVPSSFHAAARECGASVSNLGSLFFEEMSCSGYDPQRRQFASPIKIKQPFGFGGAPLPGSREHVLHCVADASGTLVPVGHDSVHLANTNQSPTWQFAVIANANQNLHTVYPMNGETRRARSILSWAFTPTNCNFTPIWGNALNYRIRLDQ